MQKKTHNVHTNQIEINKIFWKLKNSKKLQNEIIDFDVFVVLKIRIMYLEWIVLEFFKDIHFVLKSE